MTRLLDGSATRRLGGMARLLGSTVLLMAVPTPASLMAQAPTTSATLYNDGRVLVRRILPLEIRKGDSEVGAPLGAVDPASVFPLDSGLVVLGSRYDAAIDESSVLRRAIGRRLTFRVGKDTLVATLVGVDPERYKLTDGTIIFYRPGQAQYPADLVTLEPTLRLALSSDRARSDLRLGYFAQGGGWTASYQLLLGGATSRFQGSAVINGGPLRLQDIEVQLLAGQVNVAADAVGNFRPRMEAMAVAKAAAGPMPSEQKVGEFHLYTLPGRATLEPGLTTTVGLFQPADVKATRSFELHGQIPYWGGLPQNGEEDESPIDVIYTVARPRKTDLGDRPLPGGVVRIFQPDSGGRLQLIGEAAIDHSPAGEDLRLPAGTAFDLTAKRTQLTYATKRDSIPGGGGAMRTVATADYRVVISNSADQPATVDVLEERGGEWSVVSSSIKPEKLSSTRTRFRLPVPARGKATLTYKVRVIW